MLIEHIIFMQMRFRRLKSLKRGLTSWWTYSDGNCVLFFPRAFIPGHFSSRIFIGYYASIFIVDDYVENKKKGEKKIVLKSVHSYELVVSEIIRIFILGHTVFPVYL